MEKNEVGQRCGYVCASGSLSSPAYVLGTATVKSFCEEAMTVDETAREYNRLATDAEEAAVLRDGDLEESFLSDPAPPYYHYEWKKSE